MKTLLLISPLIIILSGCNIINPPDPIPAYLQIDTTTFSCDVTSQGSTSQRITDLWIDANNTSVGVFDLGSTVPVIAEGETPFIFSAGVFDNGIEATRVIYPFFYPDTITLNLSSGEITPYTPEFRYRSATQFKFIENFEAGNLFDKIGGDTNIVRENTDAFEGNYSGEIYLDQQHSGYEGRSHNSYTYSLNQPVYLEMNYKCNQQFDVGIYAVNSNGPQSIYNWHINAKDSWNKIYLDMSDQIKSLNATSYQILFRAVLDSTQQSEGNIYLDNLKLLSF